MKTLKYRVKGQTYITDPETGKVTKQELIATVESEEATDENMQRVKAIAVDGLYDVLENAAAGNTLHKRLAVIEAGWARIMKMLNLN